MGSKHAITCNHEILMLLNIQYVLMLHACMGVLLVLSVLWKVAKVECPVVKPAFHYKKINVKSLYTHEVTDSEMGKLLFKGNSLLITIT